MLISFIISSQGKDDKMFKTISSFKKQTDDDFEIIIINDDPTGDKESYTFLKDIFFENEKIILVNNSKSQGHAFNWNNGIQLANGEYVSFIKEGDILNDDYVSTIKKHVKKYNKMHYKIDIIQHARKLTGLYNEDTTSFLSPDSLYELPDAKEVFAYANATIYGKLFRTKYIRDFRIEFRKSVRYDALFVYKALGHARTFFNASEVLLTNKISVLKYSAFDLANQWPHILNYYRRIGIYKDLKDEINYAYFYNLVETFLLLVKKFKNKTLYKKSLKYVQTKIEHKLEEFVKNNKIFKEKKDKEFVEIMTHFNSFIKAEMRQTR